MTRCCSICGERIPQLSHEMLKRVGYTILQEEDLVPVCNAPAEALPFYFCASHSKSEITLWLHEAVICNRDRLKIIRPRLERQIRDSRMKITGDY